MQKNNLFFLFVLTWMSVISFSILGYAQEEEDYKILQEIVRNEFQKSIPAEQGANLNGIIKRFHASDKKAAIALEACLDTGAEVDEILLSKFVEKGIPISLFVDQGWLQKNSSKIQTFISSGKVLLENHGVFCRPLSVVGKGVKNHPGTTSVDDVFEEVEKNARIIEKFSGRLPRFFKSGYSFYDDVSLKIVSVLGYAAVEGDLKLRAKDVTTEADLKVFMDKIQPGSIISMPANRPDKSEVWLAQLLAGLSQRGIQIASLDEVIGSDQESR